MRLLPPPKHFQFYPRASSLHEAVQQIFLAASPLAWSRLFLPRNLFWGPLSCAQGVWESLRSSIPTNGRSAWSWAFAASCCPSSSKLLSARIPELLDDSNRSIFFGLLCFLGFSWVSSSPPSVSMQILGSCKSTNTAMSLRLSLPKFVRRDVDCPTSSFLDYFNCAGFLVDLALTIAHRSIEAVWSQPWPFLRLIKLKNLNNYNF